MSAGDFIIAAVLFWFAAKPRKRFQTTILWVLLYSIGRFLVEFLRADARGTVGPLSTSQFIAILCIPACLLGFKFLVPVLEKKKETEEAAAEDSEGAVADTGDGDEKETEE